MVQKKIVYLSKLKISVQKKIIKMNNLQLYSSDELGSINFLFFSPGGDFFVTGGNKTVTVMQVAEKQFNLQKPNPKDFVQRIELETPEHEISSYTSPISASLSPTEIFNICVGYEDGKVRLWNIKEKTILWTLDTNQHNRIRQFIPLGHDNTNPHVSFFPDGKKILLGVLQKLISVDISSGEPNEFTCKLLICNPNPNPVECVCFFPTKNVGLFPDESIGLFCVGFQGLPFGEIFVMSEKDENDDYRLPLFKLNSHLTVLAISPNSNYICAGDAKGNLLIYNLKLKSTKIVTYHTDAISSVAFTPDEKHICSCSKKNGLIFYESESGERLFQINQAHLINDTITHCTFSSNGRYLILGGEKINIYLNPFAYWDLKEHNQVIKHYPDEPNPNPYPSVPKNIMTFFLGVNSFSPRLPIDQTYDILEHLTYYGLFLHGNPEFV